MRQLIALVALVTIAVGTVLLDGAGAGVISGVTLAEVSSPETSGGVKTVQASCSSGFVAGWVGRVKRPGKSVFVQDNDLTINTVEATAKEIKPYDKDWSLTVEVLCYNPA